MYGEMTFTYRVLLRPKDISFTKKLIPSVFDNGILVQETLQQLLNEEILLEDIPTIDVVWCREKWQWYTLNSRRLWVFRELEKKGRCQYIATKHVGTVEDVTDFLLYGSAELIGESHSVSWDSEDGLKITVFDQMSLGQKHFGGSPKEKVSENLKTMAKDGQTRRDWRERTPLTVKITWDGQGENNIKRTLDLGQRNAAANYIKRERKDSGFSELSSERSFEKSKTDEGETESGSHEDDCLRGNKFRRRRFNKFRRYRPYSYPESSNSSCESQDNDLKAHRSGQSALRSLVRQRKRVYDRLLFILHHGGKSRSKQYAIKKKLMHTCGFCYKSFRAGVSLAQHEEELRHWACIRCGKYFKSYTALGQHKLSLYHCNV